MKKLLYILCLMAVTALSSCVSSKKINYFQGADTLFQTRQKITQHYDLRLKPADQVTIRVSSSNPELLAVFSQDKTMGQGGNGVGTSGGGISNGYAYPVTTEGNLKLPHLGLIHVEGLTEQETARLVEQKIKESGLVSDPQVEVKLSNAHVTIIGATSGVIQLSSPRTSLFDIISQLGDLNDISKRQNIRLYREENGKRRMYKLDITKADIFQSPAFYVQQNDLIYIEPNKSQNIKSSATSTYLAAGATILGAVISLINMGFWIKNFK